jgi:Polyketide cyclase / dehydrase and lipid transport
MSTPSDVDRSAPVLAHHTIEIAAPPHRVWALHTGVNDWPTWQSAITAAELDADTLAPALSFTWTSYGFTVTSTVYELTAPTRVLWGGTGDGITGIHEWVFTPTVAGTIVETTESFAGEPVSADVAGMQQLLDGSLSAWIQYLKAAAEEQ